MDYKKIFDNEIADAKMYHAAAKEHPEHEGFLRDMSHEELTHAKHVLEMAGNPHDMHEAYEKAWAEIMEG